MSVSVTTPGLVARSKTVASVADEYADWGDKEGRLTEPVLDALHREGLFGMWLPLSISGGAELDPTTVPRRETREHVAQVAREIPPDPHTRAPEPADNRLRRVKAARDPLRSGLQLRGRHKGGFEHAVLLPVVLRPVGGQDSSVSVQAPEGWSPGHGYNHAYRRDVHAGFVEELGGASEDPSVVLVEAEHDPEVDRDSIAVQHGDEPAVCIDAVMPLVRRVQALL